MSASLTTKIVIESEGSVCVCVYLLACVIHHGKCAHTKGEAHSERRTFNLQLGADYRRWGSALQLKSVRENAR